MEDASVYFGVECRTCLERVPLVELESGPHVACWTVPTVKPFSVVCPQCHYRHDYKARHVIVYSAPPPSRSFIVHPAFRNA